ncbi:MAG: helix-turn-helix transcriptional regulator [Nitrospira sp.]|nr:helix-turn-helix transcriptional regulator [Nitrospira sp.]
MAASNELLTYILEQLAGSVKNILHPSLYERTLREIGVQLGREIAKQTERAPTAEALFRQEDYLRCLELMKKQIGWNHRITQKAENRIDLSIPQCPFGKLPAEDPHFCQLEAGLLGGIAGDHFSYAKVEICRGQGVPLKNCSLTVHLEQTPHNTTVEGATFQSVQASAKQSQTLAHMFSQLFPREQQVIRLLGAGFPNKEIGNTLGLSVRTVEGHLARVREKTDLHTRRALIRWAVQMSSNLS